MSELTCAEFHKQFDAKVTEKEDEPLLSNFTIMRKRGLGIPAEVSTFIRSDYCCDCHYALYIASTIDAVLSNPDTSSIEIWKSKED